jgi:predicted DCC family thiol-disulfide oxidoreductase YuxK
MYKKKPWPLTLDFDGACPLCAREIKTLCAQAVPDRLLFVDIRDDAFDAKSRRYRTSDIVFLPLAPLFGMAASS